MIKDMVSDLFGIWKETKHNGKYYPNKELVYISGSIMNSQIYFSSANTEGL